MATPTARPIISQHRRRQQRARQRQLRAIAIKRTRKVLPLMCSPMKIRRLPSLATSPASLGRRQRPERLETQRPPRRWRCGPQTKRHKQRTNSRQAAALSARCTATIIAATQTEAAPHRIASMLRHAAAVQRTGLWPRGCCSQRAIHLRPLLMTSLPTIGTSARWSCEGGALLSPTPPLAPIATRMMSARLVKRLRRSLRDAQQCSPQYHLA